MNRINRNNPPACLTTLQNGRPIFLNKGIAWNTNYAIHKNASRFSWGQFQNQNVSELIVLQLSLINDSHCAYCDAKNVKYGIVRPEIDHFCPKTVKPLKAYYYPNLFLSCTSCNGYKGNKYDKRKLLKFDSLEYNFDDYFYLDFDSGKIRTRPDISLENRFKARFTLTVFGINKDARPETRLEELASYENSINKNINNYSYRFFIERSLI